jgi:adenosylcobinamide-phosphate guanylyltransferase
MLALILAGGAGSRLNLGEKPLVTLLGRPMLSYIVDAFADAGCTPVVAASLRTPMTINWCRAQGIEFCKLEGKGYIEDTADAVINLGEAHPLFVCVSDIPCITGEIVVTIRKLYLAGEKDACSTWIPSLLARSNMVSYQQEIHGTESFPAGVNILRGDRITDPQEELQILLREPRLAFNVNTREDRADAEVFLRHAGTNIRTPG